MVKRIYTDINTELRKQAKSDFQKNSFKLMNSFVFEKTMDNVRNYRDIKTAATDGRRNQFVPEPNHHMTKCFSEDLLAIC